MRALLIVTVLLTTSCAGWLKDVRPVGDVVQCVLEHDRETPEVIAASCAGATVEAVIAILDAENKAEARHLQAGLCGFQ